VNLLEGRDREEQAMFSPSKIEKERLRAEAEVNASLLREKDDGKKKEEVVAAVASPGTSLSPAFAETLSRAILLRADISPTDH
jgi:hypothetical protein